MYGGVNDRCGEMVVTEKSSIGRASPPEQGFTLRKHDSVFLCSGVATFEIRGSIRPLKTHGAKRIDTTTWMAGRTRQNATDGRDQTTDIYFFVNTRPCCTRADRSSLRPCCAASSSVARAWAHHLLELWDHECVQCRR